MIAAGTFTLSRMQVELYPDIDLPLVTLVTSLPQADPETVLTEITIPFEKAAEGVKGLSTVRSVSSEGLSVVIAEFELGTDMKQAAGAIAGSLDGIVLPPGVQGPRVARVNPDEFPVLQLSVLLDSAVDDLYDLVTTAIVPEIEAVPGVLSVGVPAGAGAGSSISRTNGEPSLAVSVVKDPDASTVTVVGEVMETLKALKPRLPEGVKFVTVVNQAPQIQASVDTMKREATLGALFAVAVIFAFLLSVRPTLVISISIPTSILGGLVLMGWQGMNLNMMTLGGLAIAVGRVVDDSIVVLENIYRHIQRDGDRRRATLTATGEVAGAIVTSTLTTIAVFLPLAFIGGIIGTFFLPFALTVTFALLASLVVALTVVPVLGSILIRPGHGARGGETWVQRGYAPLLRWALGHKLATLAIALTLFVGSVGLVRLIPQTFLPSLGADLLTVDITLPRGTSMETMLEEVMQAEGVMDTLRRDGVVDTFQVTVGSSDIFGPGWNGGGSYNTASFYVLLTGEANGTETADLLRRELAGQGRSVSVAQIHGGGYQGNLLELTLTGDDYAEVSAASERIVQALRDMSELENVGSDAVAATTGDPGLEGSIPISRVNGRRAVTISGSITGTNTQRINRLVSRKVEEVGLPPGVHLETGGVFADMQEAFSQMGRTIVLGVILVFLVMVVSMRSVITPFVIILSLPLASIGAMGALFMTQRTLGLPALIGLLMLIGLVVTNAIVLIAFVEQLRARGASAQEAVIQGGQTRLRPILMTAFTTSFALLPLAVMPSKGVIIGAELATVVIGGLMTSTFLTLVVIPVVYCLVRRGKAPGPGTAAPGP